MVGAHRRVRPRAARSFGDWLDEELATSSPPTAELPLKGKLEGVRFLSNKISLLEDTIKSSSQLLELPLEGKLSALPTDEV